MIRHATIEDASRIAEISIFSKRTNYRDIFHDDQVSFGEMQVYPLVLEYREPGALDNFFVYDDGFVKGFMHLEVPEVMEMYVDPFFVGQGIGTRFFDLAIGEYGCDRLWVLEKNEKAQRLYRRIGFKESGARKLEDGTPEYIIEMKLDV